jgi:arabinose-5-phosphate isomerase
LKLREFGPEDYAFFHPGGSLGRKLMKVEELMRRGPRLSVIEESATVQEAISKITAARSGAIAVTDGRGRLTGIFTDGDFRRQAATNASLLSARIGEVMTRSPRTIGPTALCSEAARILREKRIDELPVIDDEGHLVGMIDVQDILAIGLA